MTAVIRWAEDRVQDLPGWTYYPATPTHDGLHAQAFYERKMPEGYVHLYPGAYAWRWYVVRGEQTDISPHEFTWPHEAAEAGLRTYERMGATP